MTVNRVILSARTPGISLTVSLRSDNPMRFPLSRPEPPALLLGSA